MAFLLNSETERDLVLRMVRNERGEVYLEFEAVKRETVLGVENVGTWTKPANVTMLLIPGQVVKITGGVARDLELMQEESAEAPRRKIRK